MFYSRQHRRTNRTIRLNRAALWDRAPKLTLVVSLSDRCMDLLILLCRVIKRRRHWEKNQEGRKMEWTHESL